MAMLVKKSVSRFSNIFKYVTMILTIGTLVAADCMRFVQYAVERRPGFGSTRVV